jgi:hypothetical protein
MLNYKKIALIGSSGLIGKVILNSLIKKNFKISKYNSRNITNIKNKKFYKIYCAGLPAEKWKANNFPNKDRKNMLKLLNNLKKTKCDKFYLISSIDTHKPEEAYGKNRLDFENYIKKIFSNYLIIRLPGVFGNGLKKNIIFDLLNRKNLENISKDDYFQWYNLKYLFSDINKYEKKYGLNRVIELYSKPIKNHYIIKLFPKLKILHQEKKNIKYDIKPNIGYYKNKKTILNGIKNFIKNYG